MAASTTTAPPHRDRLDSFGFDDGREQGLREYIFARPDLETSLRNNPKAVLAAISEYTAKKRMITFGEVKINKCRELLAQMNPAPKTLIELGTYVGMSAIGWGDILKSLNPGEESRCKVFAMELDPKFAAIARDLVDLAGLKDIVTVLEGPAADNIRALKTSHTIDKVDVAFFDQWQESYKADLMVCEECGIFRVGSTILADNTDIPGTPDYNQYLEESGSRQGGVKYQNVKHETASEVAKIVLASTVLEVA
ncbi:hypothetical protein LTR99_008223 [Exophiala xenobiotica]|uniref:catechol O-methyltransferase n=1 Tax=Vermiconidia calcicola TaxID=1690605 RepID=A0AAV9PWE0_9PEZI|nr:hypothetical protein LTR92_001047 [Exophiala xenobiotica]KAK5528371.1 hypothetical protein LTR25_010370 [Vermiconidia calcicola]KAK5205655.1 hypothetical protein LTR41_008723 [Exophiala xenobiotica]KAK5223489.1 hypothetical protein LTR72_004875 [Exophiala xenobiotica]KAK5230474.1 hypothetical protein LTR47_007616 [Exophiala xenobiotica]